MSDEWLARRAENARLFQEIEVAQERDLYDSLQRRGKPEAREVTTEGVKHDEGKLDLTLIPPELLEEVAKVLMHGAAKYDRHNWTKVPDAEQRYAAAMLRHVLAWQKGEILDPETGLHHLAHAACCVAFLLSFWRAGFEPREWRVRHRARIPIIA